jgi:hypothetical protein
VIGLSVFVTVLVFVRDMHRIAWACLLPAWVGLTMVIESRAKYTERRPTQKKLSPAKWVIVAICLAIGLAIGFFSPHGH